MDLYTELSTLSTEKTGVSGGFGANGLQTRVLCRTHKILFFVKKREKSIDIFNVKKCLKILYLYY